MKLSVLDVAPIPTGTTAAEVLRRMGDLARLADELGFADELTVTTMKQDPEARLRSYRLLAEALGRATPA